MSDRCSKATAGDSPAANEVADDVAPAAAVSGRAAFDSRGTTVWEWQTETGVFSRDASTSRVHQLLSPELTLEKTIVAKRPEIEEPQLDAAPCGGFNPYNRAVVVKSELAAQRRPLTPPRTKAAVVARRPVTWLERLRAMLTGK
jgi:hypothetical protein